MIKAFILQSYLAPYRVNLFNEINKQKYIDLQLIYFSKYEKRSLWLNKIFNP